MKKNLLILSVCLMLFILSACGKIDNGNTVPVQPVELDENQEDEVSEKYEPENASFESDTEKVETDAQEEMDIESGSDYYAGVYKDYDVDEPNLEIQINEDGTYAIQIGIYRLAYLDDGVGNITEKGLEFSATAPNGNEARGIITLDNEVATVTFTAGWSDFSDINEFKYYKVTNTPNMYVTK